MKKLLIILGIVAMQFPVFGQNTKKMNSIKRSPMYLYAEATMENAAEAYEVANDLLLIQIREYAAERKALDGKDIIIKDIQGRQDSLQISRGDMVKVFLYVKKSDIQGVDNVTLVQTAAQPQTEAPKGNVLVQSNVVPVNPEPETVSTPAASDASLKLETHWQQSVIDQLLSSGGYYNARSLLARLKAEFKIKRFGPMTECKNPSEVFLLVGKGGSVVTVLGPGAGSRTDFKELKKTSDSYDGYDKVWFTFSK